MDNQEQLSIATDLIDNNIGKKVFTKMDLRWEYNNVRIKEEDKWKAAFSMPEGAFEPMVIFFGLTNSLVTFQTMINDLLRDIIEAGDVVAFINDVMVEIETEKEYNNIVEELLRKIAENNLFIKLEKNMYRRSERLGF